MPGISAVPYTDNLRYFNVAGASEDGLFGELHDPETHLIPNLLKAAVQGSPFKLFGTDYPTRDGTAERDYLHVEDLAQAHVLALERLAASVLKCGQRKVWLDPNEVNEISMANSRPAIRS